MEEREGWLVNAGLSQMENHYQQSRAASFAYRRKLHEVLEASRWRQLRLNEEFSADESASDVDDTLNDDDLSENSRAAEEREALEVAEALTAVRDAIAEDIRCAIRFRI